MKKKSIPVFIPESKDIKEVFNTSVTSVSKIMLKISEMCKRASTSVGKKEHTKEHTKGEKK